jgi:5-(carboxyamino)imidazole ribonucleotide synthase
VTTIGVLGAGQLGRMLALAGYPLGLRFRFLDPAAGAPASHLAEQDVGGYLDIERLERFSSGLDAITYEFENVPVGAASLLAGRVPVYPPAQALAIAQDRLTEKSFFQQLGVETPPFAPVDSRGDLEAAIARVGVPAVLKTRRLGYDGKGQFVLGAAGDAEQAWAALSGNPLILEGFVAFEREVSILAARGRDRAIVFYPLVENHHRDGMLRLSLAPAPGHTPTLQAAAQQIAAQALEALGYVGILAIELFQVDGRLLVNEMAPRVHNSGHWTIEGAETSQFENHLRAVLGLPLGSTAPRGYAAMLNLIGELPDPSAVLKVPGAHLHIYGKEPRAGRKLGHVTLRADDPETLEQGLAQLREIIG